MRKPWYWTARKAWYIKVQNAKGNWVPQRLHEDKATAHEIWGRRFVEGPKKSNHQMVRDILMLFVEHLNAKRDAGDLSPLSATRRKQDIASFYSMPELDGLRVSDLERFHGTTWLQRQTTWCATTKHHAAKLIRRVFSWAVDEGYIESNPLKKFKHAPGLPRQFCIDRELHEEMILGTSDPRKCVRAFRLILIMLRLSGCRPGEVCDMEIERIDFEQKEWTWRFHKTAKKTGKRRIVTCSPCLWTLTRIAAHGRDSGPLVRPNAQESWTYDKLRQRFERLRKKLGAPSDCVAYSYRHASITDALKAGVDVATVARMHGTSIEEIQRSYEHVIQDKAHMQSAAVRAAQYRMQKVNPAPPREVAN